MSATDIFQFQVDGSRVIRIKKRKRYIPSPARRRESKVIEGSAEKNVIRRRPEKLVCQFELTEMEVFFFQQHLFSSLFFQSAVGGHTARWKL